MAKQQQSPINIQSPIVTKYVKPLKIRWSKSLSGTLKSHHGKLKVAFSGDKNERISFDGRDFQIAELHFHNKSEHWIEDKQYPAELHIVHQNCDPKDGKLAVLGIMIEADTKAKSSPELSKVMEAMGQDESCDHHEIETNPNDWLPKDTKHYYRYEGSLTTEEHDEIVSWIVFKDSLKLPRKEFNKLIKYAAGTARLPQPLNRRFVLANFS